MKKAFLIPWNTRQYLARNIIYQYSYLQDSNRLIETILTSLWMLALKEES